MRPTDNIWTWGKQNLRSFDLNEAANYSVGLVCVCVCVLFSRLLGQIASGGSGRIDAHRLTGRGVQEPVGVALAAAVPEAGAPPLLCVKVPAHAEVLAAACT